jgi:DNA mismatch repair protein MutS
MTSKPRYGELVRQYLELRDRNPGVILLFRVGSFYEVLFEDAELVARELGLKLGDRPSGGTAPPVPQCGFAHHALDAFLVRLLRQGYRVAVCEEAADEGAALRERAVVRTLTPGTVTDPRLLREERPTYLAAATARGDRIGLAWADLAVGEFKAGELSTEEAAAELQRLDPAELLVPPDGRPPAELLAGRSITPRPVDGAEAALAASYPGALDDLPLARRAAGLIARYLAETQGAVELEPPKPASPDEALRLDAATQRHLEVVETERSRERAGSLLDAVDRCVTPMGRRMLRDWLLRPLNSSAKIQLRQRLIAELVDSDELCQQLAERLAALADLERLAGRVGQRRASPDDLRALAAVAAELPGLAAAVASARSPFLRGLGRPRPALARFAAEAAQVLAEPSASYPVRPEASPALRDALGRLSQAEAWRERYLSGLRRQPGLARARIDRNSAQGFFLEVPSNTRVPSDWVRKGGLQKSERYTTEALDGHAAELAEAEAIARQETDAALERLRRGAAEVAPEARDLARHLAAADTLVSLARVAAERGWVRPTVDEGDAIEIVQGRHAVLEGRGAFQPNDARLVARGAAGQLVVLTGPNMAGKSTWMRQVALIVLLAQAGSFVPAVSARIGLVDAIYTRIGAVDDLAGGRSTFMVEMLETASVLRGATDRSLVLLDEIGRGTSTHDGMAIAWAVIEELATGASRPRAIVATHYHELAALAQIHPAIVLMRAAVEERPDGVVFSHRIEPGGADRSFGIEVARLAGLPGTVLERARRVADALEPISAEIAKHLGEVGRRRGAGKPGRAA